MKYNRVTFSQLSVEEQQSLIQNWYLTPGKIDFDSEEFPFSGRKCYYQIAKEFLTEEQLIKAKNLRKSREYQQTDSYKEKMSLRLKEKCQDSDWVKNRYFRLCESNKIKTGYENNFSNPEIRNKCADKIYTKERSSKIKKSRLIKSFDRKIEFLKNLNLSFLNNEECEKYKEVGPQNGDGSWNSFKLKCELCGYKFESPLYENDSFRCPVCFPKSETSYRSYSEIDFYNWLESIHPELKRNCHIKGSTANYDIVIPGKKLIFEFDESKTHSFATNLPKIYADKYRESRRTQEALDLGYSLYHIHEYDWNHKQDIIKSLVKTRLGLDIQKLFARKLKIKEVKSDLAKNFHLHGTTKSNYKVSLFLGDLEITCMEFVENKTWWEISRYTILPGYQVIGGFNKLLSYFIKTKQPSKIITYCDRDLSPDYKNTVYYRNGFKFVKDTGPILRFINSKTGEIKDRRFFWGKKFEGMSQIDGLRLENWYQKYNSGNWKFVLEL